MCVVFFTFCAQGKRGKNSKAGSSPRTVKATAVRAARTSTAVTKARRSNAKGKGKGKGKQTISGTKRKLRITHGSSSISNGKGRGANSNRSSVETSLDDALKGNKVYFDVSPTLTSLGEPSFSLHSGSPKSRSGMLPMLVACFCVVWSLTILSILNCCIYRSFFLDVLQISHVVLLLYCCVGERQRRVPTCAL